MYRITLTGLALLFAGIVGLWWTCFHNKRLETALWLGQHHSELAQIRGELDAHPALCKVWIGAPPDVLCDKHLTPGDKDAFRRVTVLLRRVDGIDVSSQTDYRGRLGHVSVQIFAQSFASPPEYAEWFGEPGDPYLQLRGEACAQIGLPQWYACDGKVIFI